MEFANDEAMVRFILSQKLPEWKRRLYEQFSKAVQVHSQGQLFYKLDRLFPNEEPASKAHRLLSFESVTEASFGRAANNVNRIFKNSSYTVTASEKTIEALDKTDFEGQNFYSWFLDQWTTWALKEDPNSRIAFYPPDYTKQGNPSVRFVLSKHLRYEDEETVVFISEEESEVAHELVEASCFTKRFYDQSVNRWNVREAKENTYMPVIATTIKRPVYHIFTKGAGFYRAEQSKENEKEWFIDFYPIKAPFLPVTDVGGEKNAKDINKSFLHPFVSFGNLALLQHSQHTAVNFTFSFPRMSEVESPCEAEGCSQGKIECEESAQYPLGMKDCGFCGGTGYKSNQTPYKIYKKRVDPNAMEGDEKTLAVPMVEYYTPDVAILAYSKGEWKEYLEMAETAVYIQQRVQTGNVQAAKSKEIDREDMYAFLSAVAKVFFGKLRFSMQAFENYLIPNPTQVSVVVPFSFAIVSETEAFNSLNLMLASPIPVMLKANEVESFINKFVSMTSPIKRFLDVLKIVDPLMYYSVAELTQLKATGTVSGEQMVIHVYAFPTLQKMYLENKKLFDQDVQVIATKLLTELEVYKPEPPQTLQGKFQPPKEPLSQTKQQQQQGDAIV